MHKDGCQLEAFCRRHFTLMGDLDGSVQDATNGVSWKLGLIALQAKISGPGTPLILCACCSAFLFS